MPDFNLSAETRNKAVDTALDFVSPTYVVERGPESTLATLKVARTVLSSIYHPDRTIGMSTDEDSTQRGLSALLELGGVINKIEHDSEEDGLLTSIAADSARLVGRSTEPLKEGNYELPILHKLLQGFQHNLGNGHRSDLEIEHTGKVGERKVSPTLGIIFGDKMLSLLGADGIPPSHLAKALKIIRGKLDVIWENGSLGVSTSELGVEIDEMIAGLAEQAEETQRKIILSSNEGELIHDLSDEVEHRADEAAEKIVEYLRPDAPVKTPENWWRNFSGDLVVPVNLELWDDYEEVLGQGLQPELSDVAILSIDGGVVSNLVILNPEERFNQGTALLSRLPKHQQVWCEALIDHVARQMAVLEDYYLGKPYSHGRKASFVDENGQAMDFIFRVESDGTAETLYYRLNYKKQLIVPKIKLEVGKAPKPGYYMLKAGKLGGVYPVPNTPIGLVHLNPMDDDSLVRTLRGSALAGISTQDGSMLEVSSTTLTDLGIDQVGKFIPATAGKALNIRDDYLKEVVRGSLNYRGLDYYISSNDQMTARNLALFIGNKGGAVLSTFGDEAIHAIRK